MGDYEYEVTSTSRNFRREPEQNKKYYTNNRGRGRQNPNVNKALCNFGVSDLRQLLDKKYQERGQASCPPADPTHNYLKDPLRETSNNEQIRSLQKVDPKERPSTSSKSSRDYHGRRNKIITDERQSHKISCIVNPVNIKIELKTSTGERSCKLDKETKLPDIKHIADHRPEEQRSFPESHRATEKYNREWGTRGGGRGRSSSRRGTGTWENSRGMRGRGRRPGRGQGRPPFIGNRNQEKHPESCQPYKDDDTEENWEPECSVLLDGDKVLDNKYDKCENGNEYEEYEHEQLQPEEYIAGGGEDYSEIIADIHVNGNVNETEENINLPTITSSRIDEGNERTDRLNNNDEVQVHQEFEKKVAEEIHDLRRNTDIKANHFESEYSALSLSNLLIKENDEEITTEKD